SAKRWRSTAISAAARALISGETVMKRSSRRDGAQDSWAAEPRQVGRRWREFGVVDGYLPVSSPVDMPYSICGCGNLFFVRLHDSSGDWSFVNAKSEFCGLANTAAGTLDVMAQMFSKLDGLAPGAYSPSNRGIAGV
ncbi:MAG: hypothetical protein KF899_16345, partial [Parvibaculum sp.]|nr:hypothetical protein [Parvibaculum sp.]